MKYFVSAVSAVVASVVVGVLAQNNISIPTPSNVVQCTNISITWQGGSPPFTLLFQNGNANGAILQTVSDIPSNTYIWNTDIQGPTQIGMTVRDTNGVSGQSGPFEINANSDMSCLNAAASVTASGTDSAASTASGSVTDSGSAPVSTGSSTPAGSSASSGGSSAATTSGSSSASGSGPASSGSAASTSSGAAASQTSASSAANVAVTGFTGLFSVLLAAFLA